MTLPIQKLVKLAMSVALAGLFSFALFSGISLWATPVAYAAGETCFATIDNNTIFSSTDASAVQTAVDAASPNDIVKIAGTCPGVQSVDGSAQTVLINKDVTLQGGYTTTNWLAIPDPDINPTRLDALGLGRVVLITGTAQAQVENLIVISGTADAGGGLFITTTASLLLSNSQVISNIATGGGPEDGGGGLGNLGQTIITGTIFSHNLAGQAGAVGNGPNGTLSIENSTFTFNHASLAGALGNTGWATVTASTFISSAAAGAGAIGNGQILGGPGWMLIQDSTFISNTSGANGGAIDNDGGELHIINSAFTGNMSGGGGAIYNNSTLSSIDPTLYITNSTFISNRATGGSGGGMLRNRKGQASIYNSTLDDNATSDEGGAIFAQSGTTVTISYSTLSNNRAQSQRGGAVSADGALVIMENVTLSGNASPLGGGIYGKPSGSQSAIISLTHTSLVSNTSGSNGGGIYLADSTDANSEIAQATLINSLIVGNNGGDCARANSWEVFDATAGYNLDSDGSCVTDGVDNNLTNADPKLGPLQNNGGDTATHALLEGSPAINTIPNSVNGCGTLITTDQRAFTRPQGELCDMGAFESDFIPSCFVETTGDANTDYASQDASALRQAIADASPGDTLKIAGICAGVDDTTLLNDEYAVINLTKSLTLTGGYTATAWLDSPNLATNPTTLDGLEQGRVVRINNVVVTLENLQITHGANISTTTNGAGFYITGGNADVTIRNSRIFSNTTQHFGGAFYISNSDVTLEASQVYSNTADRGGAIYHEDGGTNIIDGSEISHNEAGSFGGGVANNQQVTFLITDSVISNNVAQNNSGGGIWLINNGYAELVNSTVISNSSGKFGGGLFNDLKSTMVLTNTTVRDNQAIDRGGGINNDGVMFIHNSTVVTNTVTDTSGKGGGIYLGNSSAVITQTGTFTVAYNQAEGVNGEGGAFYVGNGRLNLNMARILSNTAGNNGGAVYQHFDGDGVTITNSCIVNNDDTAIFNSNGPQIDATANWWGANDGPSGAGPGHGDSVNAVSLNVSGFLTNTVLDCPTIQRTIVVNTAGSGNGTVDRDPDQETYDVGSAVTLTATANPGSTFVGWTGDITSTASTVLVTLTADITATANFTVAQHLLTVATAGVGSGDISSNPAGINCGGDCTEIYDYGTEVTLAANADTGSSFSGWSGACTNPTGDCVVTIDSAKDVTALFTLNQYALNVATAGAGSGSISSTPAGIDCGGDCTENYDFGTVVTLTANADTGSSFDGWSGACTNDSGDCVVTIDNAKNVTAAFTLNQYALNVATAGAGSGSVSSNPAGIDCGGDCTESYDYGTVVTLTATPDAESSFSGWSGNLSGATTPNTITIDGNKTVTATFVDVSVQVYTLTTNIVGHGVVTPSTSTVPAGTVVTLTATADEGWSFAMWSGDLISTDNPAAIILDANKFITATFVTATVSTTLTLEITPENPFAEEPITLTATVSVNAVSVDAVTAAAVNACPTTGDVTFFADNNSLGEVSLNDACQAVLTLNDGLPAANYTISAAYAGDAGYLPATSAVTLSVSAPEASEIFMPRLHR